MLRVTPKSFDTVDVIFCTLVDHVFLVFNGVMLAQPFEGIVASKLVRKVHRSLSRLLSNNSHEFLGGDSLDNTRVYPSVAFQKPKHNAFALGATSSSPFAPAAKVAFVKLNLSRQFAALKFCHVIDRLSQSLIHSGNGLVVYAHIMRQFIGRLRLVEALHYCKLSSKLREAFLPFALPAFHIATTGTIEFERTAKNTLSTPLKVGRTTENVLLPCNHMDILSSIGYDYH